LALAEDVETGAGELRRERRVRALEREMGREEHERATVAREHEALDRLVKRALVPGRVRRRQVFGNDDERLVGEAKRGFEAKRLDLVLGQERDACAQA